MTITLGKWLCIQECELSVVWWWQWAVKMEVDGGGPSQCLDEWGVERSGEVNVNIFVDL